MTDAAFVFCPAYEADIGPHVLCECEPNGSGHAPRARQAVHEGGREVALESRWGASEKAGDCTGSESRSVLGTSSGS